MNSKCGKRCSGKKAQAMRTGSHNSEETQKASMWHAQGLASCWMTGQMIKTIEISTSE